MIALKLRKHRADLRAVEHAHDRGLDDVVKVMAEGNLVAAEGFRFVVEPSAPHLCAQIASSLLLRVRHVEDVGGIDLDRDSKYGGIFFKLLPVRFRISGIHHKKAVGKRHIAVLLQLLHQLREKHGVLPSGDADGHAVVL